MIFRNLSVGVSTALVGFGFSVQAAVEVPQSELDGYAEPIILLATDGDMALTAALAAAGQTLGTSGTIVKTGKGTLTVDGDAIASFDGEIHIWEGAWKVSAAGHLGTAVGATFVHGTSNAEPAVKTNTPDERPPQLWFDTDPNNLANFPGEAIHLAGAGFCHQADFSTGAGWGWGAIFVKPYRGDSPDWPATGYEARWGSKWILDADATAMVSGKKPEFSGVDLELNGHELFIFPSTHYSAIHATTLYGFKQREGNVEMSWFKSVETGDAPSKIRLGYGMYPDYDQTGGSAKDVLELDWAYSYVRGLVKDLDWTLSATNEALFQIITYTGSADEKSRKGATENHRTINVPVRLNGDLYLGSMTANASLTLLGQTSGPGRFCALGNKSQPIYVYLDNPANTFTGGVLVDSRAELIVGADGSIPANGGPVVVSNAVVRTEDFSVGDRHLPDLELAGVSTYRGFLSHANWKNVRKTTDGTSNWESLSGAESVSVEAGELEIDTPYVGSQADYWGFTKVVSTHDVAGMSWSDFVGQATTIEGHAAGNWLFSWGARSACKGFAGGVDGWVWWDGADNAAWDFVVAVDKAQGVYLEINGSPVYNWDNKSFADLKLMTFADLDARRVRVRHGWNRLRCMMLSGTGNPGPTKSVADGAAFQWLAGKEVLVNTTGAESTVQDDYIMLDDSNKDGTQVMMGMLDDGDFCAASPYFGAVNVATGATLRYANAADAGAIGGTGTIVGDLTVSNVTASAANLTGALTVTGDVTLAEGAKVVVSDALLLKKVVDLPILTVTGALTAPDKIVCTSDSGKYDFAASVSADGKSLLLTARGPGLILLLR